MPRCCREARRPIPQTSDQSSTALTWNATSLPCKLSIACATRRTNSSQTPWRYATWCYQRQLTNSGLTVDQSGAYLERNIAAVHVECLVCNAPTQGDRGDAPGLRAHDAPKPSRQQELRHLRALATACAGNRIRDWDEMGLSGHEHGPSSQQEVRHLCALATACSEGGAGTTKLPAWSGAPVQVRRKKRQRERRHLQQRTVHPATDSSPPSAAHCLAQPSSHSQNHNSRVVSYCLHHCPFGA